MKPAPPPLSLLPAHHEWRVIPAIGWEIATRPHHCLYDVGIDRRLSCGEPAVAVRTLTNNDKPRRDLAGYCAGHLGSTRWIAEGRVWQWRAVAIAGYCGPIYSYRDGRMWAATR